MKQTTIWRLINPTKNYDWGDLEAVTHLFNYPNPERKPIAEVWFGAHLQGTSKVILQNNQNSNEEIDLITFIHQHPIEILGTKIADQFDSQLPFLFKILSAKTPLSIQVHPDLIHAKNGFLKENDLGIDLSDPLRNYKDPNHKPELTYAITPFYAMNGFREFNDIIHLFEKLDCKVLSAHVEAFKKNLNSKGLETFFIALLTLSSEDKHIAIQTLRDKIKQHSNLFDELTTWAIKKIAQSYLDDVGLLMPLVLNTICLQPNEAIFLTAKTPHAYLYGTALEIMANSDNVLRAGLTPKHIDIAELLENTDFNPLPKDKILTKPIKKDHQLEFPVPVSDFKFAMIQSSENIKTQQKVESVEILLCIEGTVKVQAQNQDEICLQTGESLLIAAETKCYFCEGLGTLAKAYC